MFGIYWCRSLTCSTTDGKIRSSKRQQSDFLRCAVSKNICELHILIKQPLLSCDTLNKSYLISSVSFLAWKELTVMFSLYPPAVRRIMLVKVVSAVLCAVSVSQPEFPLLKIHIPSSYALSSWQKGGWVCAGGIPGQLLVRATTTYFLFPSVYHHILFDAVQPQQLIQHLKLLRN